MRKISCALIVALFIIGCGAGTAPQRSAEETARLAYVDAALAYDVAMSALEDARDSLTDGQRSRLNQVQVNVRRYAPNVRAMLDLWRAGGIEPAAFHDAWLKLTASFAEAAAVRAEVR